MEQEFTAAEIRQLTILMFNAVESPTAKSVMLKDNYVRRVTSEILKIDHILYHKQLSKVLRLKELWPYTKYTYKNNSELKQILTFH